MRRRARVKDYDAGNMLAAEIILRHPHHYCSALEQWARRVLERLRVQVPEAPAIPAAGELPLFDDVDLEEPKDA